jgi:DNA primase
MNVAALIFDELEVDGLHLGNAVYEEILSIYRAAMANKSDMSMSELINHPNPDVCNTTIEILTADDNYVESALWEQKEVHVSSESEMLANGVPKVLMLFKTKILSERISELEAALSREGLSEEEECEIMQQLTACNRAKVLVAKRLQRLVI